MDGHTCVLNIACSNAHLSLLRKESLQQAGLGTMVSLVFVWFFVVFF